jgi:hypothetical protein
VYQDLQGAAGVMSGSNGCPGGNTPNGGVSMDARNQAYFEPVVRMRDTYGIIPFGG